MNYLEALNAVYTTDQVRREGWSIGSHLTRGTLIEQVPVLDANIETTIPTLYKGVVLVDSTGAYVYRASEEDERATDWVYWMGETLNGSQT